MGKGVVSKTPTDAPFFFWFLLICRANSAKDPQSNVGLFLTVQESKVGVDPLCCEYV